MTAASTVGLDRRPTAGGRPAGRPVGGARRLDRVRHGHRRGAHRRRAGRQPGPDRPRRPLVVAARGAPARRAPGGRVRRARTPWRRSDPLTAGAALDRLAAEAPAPVVVIALHGPWGEDGTVQALLESADLAYTGSGVAASALGMDKALFKRMCRGLGLPIIEWREIRAERWAADAPGVRSELTAFAAGAADPRLMIKPSRLGSSVGMTLVHDIGELTPALDLAFQLRHGRPRRAVPRWRPRPGGLRHRQRSGPPGAVRSGRDRVRPRVLRLRRQVHGRPVRDDGARRGHAGAASGAAQDRPRRLPRHRRRGLRPDRLPRLRRRPSTCPRSTRSRASPRSASSRHSRPRAATPSPTSASGSSTWPSSGTRLAVRGRLRPGGPAAMSSRPSARRTSVPTRRIALRRGERRPGCRAFGLARPWRCSWRPERSTASVPRPPSTSRPSRLTGATFTDARGPPGRDRRRPGEQPLHAPDRPARGGPARPARRSTRHT